MNNTIALQLRGVSRHFAQAGGQLNVLSGVDLSLKRGEIVALVGPSGSGKTTLLQIAGLLDKPDAGEIEIAGRTVDTKTDEARTENRLKHLGFVYQFHHLLPEFSAVENVMLPQMLQSINKSIAREKASKVLANLGLAERLEHRPGQLSGGEQQRVAIARAMANDPAVILADEPTGNLDPHTAEHVFNMLLKAAREKSVAMLIATHNMELAKRMDRIVTLREGKIEAVR